MPNELRTEYTLLHHLNIWLINFSISMSCYVYFAVIHPLNLAKNFHIVCSIYDRVWNGCWSIYDSWNIGALFEANFEGQLGNTGCLYLNLHNVSSETVHKKSYFAAYYSHYDRAYSKVLYALYKNDSWRIYTHCLLAFQQNP